MSPAEVLSLANRASELRQKRLIIERAQALLMADLQSITIQINSADRLRAEAELNLNAAIDDDALVEEVHLKTSAEHHAS